MSRENINRFIEDIKVLEDSEVIVQTDDSNEYRGICSSIDFNNKDVFLEINGILQLITNVKKITVVETPVDEDDENG